MNHNHLREEISTFLQFGIPRISPRFETVTIVEEEVYSRLLNRYSDGEGRDIPTYLLLPTGSGPFPRS